MFSFIHCFSEKPQQNMFVATIKMIKVDREYNVGARRQVFNTGQRSKEEHNKKVLLLF